MITKIHAATLYGYGYSLVDNEGNVWSIEGINGTTFNCYKLDIGIVPDFEEVSWEEIGSTYKILCRPIEDLTKEIEGVGVPIVELYKLSNESNYNNQLDFEFIESWGAGKILKVWHNRSKDEYTEFIYSKLGIRKDRTHGKGSYVFGMEIAHPIRCDLRVYNIHLIIHWLHTNHFNLDFPSGTTQNLI